MAPKCLQSLAAACWLQLFLVGLPDKPEPNTLASVGLGWRWSQGDRFTARLDWGIPLVSVDSRARTWQENGLYFSVLYNPF